LRVLAIAHRAGNDLPSLPRALALGVDVVEADVHALAGRLEVRHSKSLHPLPWLWDRPSPRTGPRVAQPRIVWTPAAQPQLSLRQLLAELDSSTTLMLDLKGAGAVGRRALQELARAPRQPPTLVCGRWWPSVEPAAGQPWARPVLTARNRAELARLRRRVRTSRRPYGVSLHRSLLTAPLVAELRERVELVMTWPVNSRATLDEVLSRGVTGVISDEAEVLRAVVGLR
jgi:glycerophosphoryl diester phosphodiesterase